MKLFDDCFSNAGAPEDVMLWPKKVLMVSPDYFDIEYAINPHMVNNKGELKSVDTKKAREQWEKLKETFESLRLEIEVMSGRENLPDMVFCANQCFPFKKNGQLNLILSEMHSEQRKPEVPFFKEWAESHQIPTHKLGDIPLEGMGDVIWDYSTEKVYGGYGIRTSHEIYPKMEEILGQEIIQLELVNERFYHLDTCFSPLGNGKVAFVKEAFSQAGLEKIKKNFKTLIEIPYEEAVKQLACNLCCPNGKDIIIQQGAKKTNERLKAEGFRIHEVDTSEYIKSGGSVFCMKLLIH